jgi:hypothetical protein
VLTKGYLASMIIGRSKVRTNTVSVDYDGFKFVRDIGAVGLINYLLFYFILYVFTPLSSLIDGLIISQVYHQNPSENIDQFSLKQATEKASNLFVEKEKKYSLSAKSTMQEKVAFSLRKKIENDVV